MKKAKKLSELERVRLFEGNSKGCSANDLGRMLGRAGSTISRELRRAASVIGQDKDAGIVGQLAHQLAIKRRKESYAKRDPLVSPVVMRYMRLFLKKRRSPHCIAGRLSRLGIDISGEAIYRYINEQQPEWKRYLKVAGKSRRRRRAKRQRKKLPVVKAPKISIEQHPQEARERLEIGHFEIDAMHGKRGTGAIQTKVCRFSRRLLLDYVPNLDSDPYATVIIKRLKELPEDAIHSILFDNGGEHAAYEPIATELGLDIFFCHPYCAYERGTVENRHKEMRHFFPKGTDFRLITPEQLRSVENHFNNMPMEVLGYRTPNEVWAEELQKQESDKAKN